MSEPLDNSPKNGGPPAFKRTIVDPVDRYSRIFLRVMIAGFIAVASYKLAVMPLSISWQGVTIEQITSLVLAIFSIILSLAFYFGANDASNKFYHQMFTFIKDTSVTLGSFQAGFGEKLDRIGGDFTELNRRIDQPQTLMVQALDRIRELVNTADGSASAEEERVRQLVDKSTLPENERSSLEQAVRGVTELAGERRSEISRSIATLEGAIALAAIPHRLLSFLQSRIVPDIDSFLHDQGIENSATDEELRTAFREVSQRYPRSVLLALRGNSLASGSRELTDDGLAIIRSLLA